MASTVKVPTPSRSVSATISTELLAVRSPPMVICLPASKSTSSAKITDPFVAPRVMSLAAIKSSPAAIFKVSESPSTSLVSASSIISSTKAVKFTSTVRPLPA